MTKLHLNEIDINRIQTIIRQIQENPDLSDKLAKSIWKSRVLWTGNFHTTAFSRELNPIEMDQVDWLTGDNGGFSPQELLLASLGSSVAIVFVTNATALGVTLEMLEIEIEGELDIPSGLGIYNGFPGYNNISITIEVKSNAPVEVLEMIQEKAIKLSPVATTLEKPVKIATTLKIIK